MKYITTVLFVWLIYMLDNNVNSPTNQKRNNFLFFLLLVQVIINFGFREKIGFDTVNYIRIINRVPLLGSSNYFNLLKQGHGEIGFKLFVSIIKTVFSNKPQSVFIAIIVIAVSLNWNSIKKYSNFPTFSLFIYFSFYFFGREIGQIRQALATSILFYSQRYLFEEDTDKFVLSVFLASSIHASSLVFLVLLVIPFQRITKNHYILLIILGMILFNIDWLGANIKIINRIFKDGIPYSGTKYGVPITSLVSTQYLRRIAPVVLIFVGYNKLFENNNKNKFFATIYILGYFLSLSFNEISILVERLTVPFIFNEIIIYSIFNDFFKNRYLRLIYRMFITLICVLFVYNLLVTRRDVFFI